MRVRSSSQCPYSACSVSCRRMSPRATSRPKDRTRYSYSTIATLCSRTGNVDTMSADPRAALNQLDGALYDAYGEMTPLDIYTGDDDGPDEDADDEVAEVLDAHDDEDGDDAHLYSGLDDDIEFEDDSSESDDDTDDTEPLRLR